MYCGERATIGTLVIRGSHKLGPEVPLSEVIEGALSEPASGLVSQVVDVPAGSTLIFFESLLHASGIITSGRDRLLIIAGCVQSISRRRCLCLVHCLVWLTVHGH